MTFGDLGKNNDGQKLVAKALATWADGNDADFILTLGDNFDKGVQDVEDDNWDDIWKRVRTCSYIISQGNNSIVLFS